LLFILAIDPLQRLLQVATARGLIYEVSRNKARLRTSLYADDAVLFIKPVKEEVARLARMLELFGGVTSLSTNVQKSSVIPIACDGLDLDEVSEHYRKQIRKINPKCDTRCSLGESNPGGCAPQPEPPPPSRHSRVRDIHLADGATTSFWHVAWARGRRPRDIARNIFRISKCKNRTLQDAVHRHNWVRDIDLRHGIP